MVTEAIKDRLSSFGYECADGDYFAIQYMIGKVEQEIKHFCNIVEVPACLEYVWVDKVCGEFLNSKKSMGQLTSIKLEPIMSSIRDGDTTVEFNNSYESDPDALFKIFVNKLIDGHTDELLAHRKIKW
jgi:hypothetical protein